MMIINQSLIQLLQMDQQSSLFQIAYIEDESREEQIGFFNKIYHIYQITKSLSNDHIEETYSKKFISQIDVSNIRAGQRNLIRNPEIQSQNIHKVYCLRNYLNNVLTYLQKNAKICGVPWVELENKRGTKTDTKVIVKFEALQICVQDYLRKNINNKSVVKNIVIKINQSFDGLASLGIYVFKRCLSNLRIKKCVGNGIEVKNVDFTHTLMLSNQKDKEEQKQLLRYLQQVAYYQIGRRDFAEILDELSEGCSSTTLRKFYDFYYQEIIQQIIDIFEQNQQLNMDQRQMVEVLKSFQSIGEDPRNKFIQRLKENQEISQSKDLNSSIYKQFSVRHSIFTQKSLLQIYEKYNCFQGMTKLSDYKSNVLIPILLSQQGHLMNIPSKHLRFIKENFQRMKQQVLKLDSEDERAELNEMIGLLALQIDRNQKNSNNRIPIIVQLIQKEKQANNISKKDCSDDFYQKRKKLLKVEDDNNNVLSESIRADQYQSEFIKQSNSNEQKQIKKQVLKQQQQREFVSTNLSIIIQEGNEQSLNESMYDSFLQNIRLQEARAESVIIFSRDISRESTLGNLENQEDKIKQFHNQLSEKGFQEGRTLELIQSMKFKRIDKNEMLIYSALLQKYERIKQYMLDQTVLLSIMRSHNYRCKNPISGAKTLYLIMDYYFKHQYNEDKNNLDRIIQNVDSIIFPLEKCNQLIKEVKSLILQQRCLVYRKFKEQIILSVFSQPKYFDDNYSRQNSRTSPLKDENLTRLSPRNQTGRSQTSININPVDYQRLYRHQASQSNSEI